MLMRSGSSAPESLTEFRMSCSLQFVGKRPNQSVREATKNVGFSKLNLSFTDLLCAPHVDVKANQDVFSPVPCLFRIRTESECDGDASCPTTIDFLATVHAFCRVLIFWRNRTRNIN